MTRAHVATAVAVAISCCTAFSQSWTTKLDASVERGVPAFSPMDGEKENINLSNGNVNITIPLLHLKGRAGMDLDLSYQVDSKTYQYTMDGDADSLHPEILYDVPYPAILGGRLTLPSLRATYVLVADGSLNFPYCETNFLFTNSEGQSFTFPGTIGDCRKAEDLSPTTTLGQGGGGYSGLSSGHSYVSLGVVAPADSYYLDLTDLAHPVIRGADGYTYYFTADQVAQMPVYITSATGRPGVALPTRMTDNNGNAISFQTVTDSIGNNATTITDTVGRQVLINFNVFGDQTMSYKDSNGDTRQIVFSQDLNSLTVPSVGMHGCDLAGGAGPANAYVYAPEGWNLSINIPVDGVTSHNRVYGIVMNSLGEVVTATYPSGGKTTYVYQTMPTWDYDLPCQFVDVREIQQKSLDDNNGNVTTTTYTPTITLPGSISPPNGTFNNVYMDVLTSSGKLDHHVFTIYGLAGYDTEVDTSDTITGHALRKTTYSPSAFAPASVTTQLLDTAPGVSSIPTATKTYTYASVPYGPLLVQSEQDTDYDGSTVLKAVTSTYQSVNPSGPTQWPFKLSSEIISDSFGTWKTTYGYDAFSLNSSSATQHDTGVNRGNLTSVTKWDGSLQYTEYLHYDDAGNILSVTDPKGYTTTAEYSNSFGSSPLCNYIPLGAGIPAAYPHTISNPKSQTTTFEYAPCTGFVTKITDANQQSTSMTYDSLGRVTSTSFPDGGSSSVVYHDPAPSSIETTVNMSPTQSAFSRDIYDGLARKISSQIGYDGDTKTTVARTVYDEDGNVWHKYLKANSLSLYDNEYYYDTLGRVIERDNEIGDPIYTAYHANVVDSADLTGNHTLRTSDALGRLSAVLEPDATTGTPSYLTEYKYDASGSLRQVDQWGGAHGNSGNRQRLFTYNGLGQLVSANNPEAGTITYTYDSNGNLQTKTDASHTILYCYDELNRLTAKSAADTACLGIRNPYAQFTYDTGGVGQLNLIGRLAGETSGTIANLHTRNFSYDPMGRLLSVQEYFTAESFAPQFHTTSMAYDWAGDITQITYPSNRVVTNSWNDRRQLTAVASGTTTYLSAATYHPSGSPATLNYGNGIAVANGENPYGQVDSIWVTKPASTGTPAQVFMALGYCYNGEDYQYGCSTDSGNNGNVTEIANLLTGDPYYGGPDDRIFTYDHLNRLTSFHKRSDAAENYSVDPWGNMTRASAGQTEPIFTTNNRLPNLNCTSYGGESPFDGTGNQLCDGDPAFTGTVHQYTYNPENQITKVADAGFANVATYTLDAESQRVRKDLASGSWREYFVANGETLSELTSDGWTDYIYANGRKIAKVDPAKPVLHLTGHRDNTNSSCGVEGAVQGTASNLNGYAIQNGDRLSFDLQQNVPTNGGLALIFTTPDANGDWGSGTAVDMTTGTPLYFNSNTTTGWQHLSGDLSSFQGRAINYVLAGIHLQTPPGDFDLAITNAVLLHQDGTISPILTGQAVSVTNFAGSNCGGTSLASVVAATAVDASVATNYYVSDHLGTAQMELSGGGWPTWKGDFDPWGQERDTQAASTAYKFTGKERDTESGNDYFGARYISSSAGRFMSPDWSATAEPVPYAKLGNPQSLNLYAYVFNNPMVFVDADGHSCGGPNDDYSCEVAAAFARRDAMMAGSNLAEANAAAAAAGSSSAQQPAQQQNGINPGFRADFSSFIRSSNFFGEIGTGLKGSAEVGPMGGVDLGFTAHQEKTGSQESVFKAEADAGVHVGPVGATVEAGLKHDRDAVGNLNWNGYVEHQTKVEFGFSAYAIVGGGLKITFGKEETNRLLGDIFRAIDRMIPAWVKVPARP